MMIDYPALMPYHERYERLEHVPLRVICQLVSGGRIAGYDPVNLDNLLARMVIDEATEGRGVPNSAEPYDLPVPLRCLWREPETGLPLFACTQLRPASEAVKDVAIWHKRAQTGAWTGTRTGTFVLQPQAGRWMDRRVPLPNEVCDVWEAEAVGNPFEVARLLAGARFLGKRRSIGFGEVAEWCVEPLDEFRLVRDGRLTRPVPAAALALLGGLIPEGEAAPVGWTPPQWKPELFRVGWWAETPVRPALAVIEG